MRNPSLYRVGGNAFTIGGILLILGLLLRTASGPDAGSTADMDPAVWHLTSVMLLLGALLVLTGLIALARHFQAGALEGVTTLAIAAGLVGHTAVVIFYALGIVAHPSMVGDPGPASEALYLTKSVLDVTLNLIAWNLAWISAGLFSWAMLREAGNWPRWLAIAGLVLAPVELVAVHLIGNVEIALLLAQIVGFTWIATVGVAMAGIARPRTAAAQASVEPAAPASVEPASPALNEPDSP